MSQNDAPDFLTLAEAAEYVGVSKDTLRRWDASGKLKPVRRPGSGYRFYRRPDLEPFRLGIGAPNRPPTSRTICFKP
ncbi:MerR family DNA-binding transcriptional regulator [Bradyrhizobium sp. RDT46]|uniref:MerR family DNA-binding transcriptional regulator n=1 Tax=Bradyrhizobium sp. RDT46 TaxID=3341829 RepID=UPI0035C77C70